MTPGVTSGSHVPQKCVLWQACTQCKENSLTLLGTQVLAQYRDFTVR